MGWKQTALFALALISLYLVGYCLNPLDRETIYTWINIIHYTTPLQMGLVILVSAILANVFAKKRINERLQIPFIIASAALLTIPYVGATQAESDFILYFDLARQVQGWDFKALLQGEAPLVPLIHATAYALFGGGYIVSETIQRFFYILLPVVVYHTGKRLASGDVGFNAALLSLTTPSILQQNHLLLQDVPVTVLAALTTYLAVMAYDEKKYLLPCALAAVATTLTKLNGAVFVAAILFGLLVSATFKTRITFSNRHVAFAALFFAAIILLVYALHNFVEEGAEKATRVAKRYVTRMLNPASGIPMTSTLFQIGLAQALLFPYALYRLKKGDKRIIIICAVAILPLILLWGLRTRYLMPAFPAVSLLIAYGLKDERFSKTMIYTVAFSMVAVTLFTTPQVIEDHVFRNVMYGAKGADVAGVREVGVYLDFVHPWLREAPLVSAVDYYFGGDVRYLCCDDRKARGSSARNKYVLPGRYLGRNWSAAELDAVLAENYSFAEEWSGGSFYHHDPYYVRLYRLKAGKSGPMEAVLYASNVGRMEGVYYDFWENVRKTRLTQNYTFGPLTLKSHYGVYMEDWLGERQLFVKPPDAGQMNATYYVVVPENASLSFSISLRPDTWHYLKGDGVRFRVLVDGDVLLDRYLDPKHNEAERRLFPYRFPLGRYSGRNATFVFQTFSGPGSDSRWDTAGFGDPAIVRGF